ncbi:hypothetical protein CERSUDRAFT_120619 [Gelatoporia subvermispora B]|uniref:Uncharacterized protein n=1 Tax=Ceriporiopsis subvermispora (strain B) TaxID=914234 RepID=M2RAY4_CERS8|nr:hypothetical protein CERSUDRAFT_120619 [Gelatoporia subvermispora B]
MARATRSAAQQEKDKPAEPAPAPKKAGTKKRKRVSNAADSEPAAKQARTDIKEEDFQEADEHLADTKDGELSSTGDMPILPSDAEKILDVLEVIDTQGLLDRVFPLSTRSLGVDATDSDAGSSTSTQSYSLRVLLKDSTQYPLRVLRSAVQHLLPIFSHQRSPPSETVDQQLRFCNLALSLLDQASIHISPIPLDAETLRPPSPDPETHSKEASDAAPAVKRRKYALVQHLPSGDWWTSLNSDLVGVIDEEQGLPDLPTANAELVAVLPTASTSTSAQTVTLGAYAVKKPPEYKPPGPRQLSCGRFLDYGPYASFAPSFDQEGAEVGRDTLGEVLWQLEVKRRRRERAKGKQRALPELSSAQVDPPQDADDIQILPSDNTAAEQQESTDVDVAAALDGLLSPEEMAAIKTGLGSLELENAVQELLDRNVRALRRLEELQLERLGQVGGGESIVEVGSEEWDVAHGTLNSLSLLASFRPRTSSSESAPLVPSASVLRKLHRTVPLEATQGWYGTLPDGNAAALHDDTTIKVKSGAVVPTAAPAAPAPAPAPAATPAPKPPTTAAPYNPYAYSNYSAQYARTYGTYTAGQASSYYPTYPTTTPGQPATHYPNSQYATGHHQYSGYSGWYNYQPPPPGAAGGTTGRATPQAGTAAPANTYASFFASAGQPQAQRAVANTVLSAAAGKTYHPGAWTPGQATGAYAPPTLPPHLRGTVGAASTPGTPQPATPGTTAPYGYYGNYQATPSTAR